MNLDVFILPTREDKTPEKTGWRAAVEAEWIRVNACVSMCDEMQSKCGSVVVHSTETCQAGNNVGQTLQGISYPGSSLSLPLIHSLLAAPERKSPQD